MLVRADRPHESAQQNTFQGGWTAPRITTVFPHAPFVRTVYAERKVTIGGRRSFHSNAFPARNVRTNRTRRHAKKLTMRGGGPFPVTHFSAPNRLGFPGVSRRIVAQTLRPDYAVLAFCVRVLDRVNKHIPCLSPQVFVSRRRFGLADFFHAAIHHLLARPAWKFNLFISPH